MALWRRPRAVRRVPLLLLVAVVVVGGTPVRARATLGFDHYNTGNGHHNRNDVSVHSPEFNRGIQHVTNTNVGGATVTQASFCKWRFRHCWISQRAKVFGR